MRLMPVEYIAMKKELPWSDYIIVVAHPDDEIIFSSSIVKNAKKVVICFNDVQGNKALSEKRSRSVKAYLVSRGISQNRIVCVGYGELHPIADI